MKGLTIMKGGVTMRVPSSDVDARLSALEGYVDMPTERTGMTITSRLDAQHSLLLALRADYTDFRAEFNAFRTETNRRLSGLEDAMGKVLYGMTEIKNLLQPDDPTPDSWANGSPPPPG